MHPKHETRENSLIKEKKSVKLSDSDDEIPLSDLKNKSLKVKKSRLKSLNNRKKTSDKKCNSKNKVRVKKKKYEYFKGKKVFTKSDSESSDFEQYTYFDESKTKRKIKIDPSLSIDDLRRKIKEIKMENVCLMKEHERVCDVKVGERMKLREEIFRLKSDILKLELHKHMCDVSSSMKGGNLSNGIIEHIRCQDVSIKESSIKCLRDNMVNFGFTTNKFWEVFHNIDHILSPNGSFWSGNLDKISPACNGFFRPSDEMIEKYSLNSLVDKYQYYDFKWNEKPNSKRKLNIVDCNIVDNATMNNTKGETEECDYFQVDSPDSPQPDVKMDSTKLEDNVPQAVADNSDTDLNDHGIEETVVATQVVEGGICTECGHDTSWTSFVSRHRTAYRNNVTLPPCKTCNMRFLKSGHFDGKHRLKRPPHSQYRPSVLMCSECGERFTTKTGLRQHSLLHKEPQYVCQQCHYVCRRKAYLKVHMKIHETKQKQLQTNEKTMKKIHNFKCCLCPYTTNKSSSFKSHMNVHTKKKMFSCNHCDYKTTSKSYLKSHINYHIGYKPFKCDVCSYKCVTSTRLKMHKKIHNGIKDYACTVCDYKTTSNFNLKVHFKRHDRV